MTARHRTTRHTALAAMSALTLLACGSSDETAPDDGAVVLAGTTGSTAGIGGAGAGTGSGGTAAGTGGTTGTSVGGTSGMTGSAAGAGGTDGTEAGSGGAGAGTGGTAGTGASTGGGSGGPNAPGEFSFFVTSLEGMRQLSGSQDGFGGNLGGLAGADSICQQLAEAVGSTKTWRAFLSASTGGTDGGPVHAIERIGDGPWYDANGRLVAMDVQGLLGVRPDGDPQSVDDLPDEHGVPSMTYGDTHDVLTGSDKDGHFPEGSDAADTCQDWTSASAAGSGDDIMCGHSWPRCAAMGGCGLVLDVRGSNWMSDHNVHGCAPGVNLDLTSGGGDRDVLTVGEAGGYGAIYCFAL